MASTFPARDGNGKSSAQDVLLRPRARSSVHAALVGEGKVCLFHERSVADYEVRDTLAGTLRTPLQPPSGGLDNLNSEETMKIAPHPTLLTRETKATSPRGRAFFDLAQTTALRVSESILRRSPGSPAACIKG